MYLLTEKLIYYLKVEVGKHLYMYFLTEKLVPFNTKAGKV